MLSYWTGVATLTGIYLIATLGVSILVGFTGLFSLGHAGFMAIGAYGTALAVKLLHLPFYVAIFVGIIAAMLAGSLIGKATLRLKGDYFVIATLAIGECTKLLIENLPSPPAEPEGCRIFRERPISFWCGLFWRWLCCCSGDS